MTHSCQTGYCQRFCQKKSRLFGIILVKNTSRKDLWRSSRIICYLLSRRRNDSFRFCLLAQNYRLSKLSTMSSKHTSKRQQKCISFLFFVNVHGNSFAEYDKRTNRRNRVTTHIRYYARKCIQLFHTRFSIDQKRRNPLPRITIRQIGLFPIDFHASFGRASSKQRPAFHFDIPRAFRR